MSSASVKSVPGRDTLDVQKLRRELKHELCEKCGLALDRGADFVLSHTDGRFAVFHENCAREIRHATISLWRFTLRTYVLTDEGKAITCLQCGATSHNPNDVRHRYCVGCHLFHDDER